ncbi:MAG: hypothetical protein J5799_04400 [Bacteroidales bacterium]|nr:hypothetical protein [Bacteroidales bacterium]
MKNIIAIISLALVLAVSGASAQQDSRVKYETTMSYHFRNVNNEFQLNGVGKVVLKGSPDQEIRCEVKVTGYGKTAEDAQARAENVLAEVLTQDKSTPKLRVYMNQGRYNEHNCKVVTTVYLPPTVVMQHNDDITIMDIVYKVLNKINILK